MNCLCGCGKEVKRKFAPGHNSRVKGYHSGQFKYDHSPSKETREKMGNAKLGKKRTLESVEKGRQKMIGRKLSDETKRKIGNANQLPIDQINHMDTLHKKIWKLLGKNECEICHITNEDHKIKYSERLHMHCESKDYHLITYENWKTLCKRCHTEYEWENGNYASR